VKQNSERLKVAALLNASAGSVEREGNETLRDMLTSAFERKRIAATLELVESGDLRHAAERALKRVRDRELDAIVVGGGDGSIRTVAGVLAGTGIALGILPLGTMNHFAKDLGIPLAIDDAVAVIAAGETRPVDLGDANGETFINNSSIGLYPFLVLDRERRRRRRGLPKWLAMILAGLLTVRHFPLRRLRIRAQGWVHPCRSPCVFVGNNEYRISGAGLGSRERLDAGQLSIYIAKQQSRLALLWLACRCVLGHVDQSRDLRIIELASVEISSRKRRLLVSFDGEIALVRSPLRYRSRPGALRVLVPSAGDA
jgi:diacylglycerol kinase family enzyme